MKQKKHNELYINYDEHGRVALSTTSIENFPPLEFENINSDAAVLSGRPLRVQDGIVKESDNRLNLSEIKNESDGITVTYTGEEIALELSEHFSPQPQMNVIVQNNSMKNCGNEELPITRFSGAKALYIGLDDEPWCNNPDRFLVHYCKNTWQGEGQWHSSTPEGLGMYPTNPHVWDKCGFSISSHSSWSTASYYPILIIEDTKRGECWFFEHEGGCSWLIECTSMGGLGSPAIQVSISAADERIGWSYSLKPGQEYHTQNAVYGVVKGGLDEAVCELVKYKRYSSLCHNKVPVIFNDYMNCSWGDPNDKNLIPLIDAAADYGCGCFCIDAGWYVDLGDWRPDNKKFGKYGIGGIISYIRSKGMLAGVWFEWECCSREFADSKPGWTLTHNGFDIPLMRPLLNFSNKEVTDYLLSMIDLVYRLGVRYIKNDYNNSTGPGIDHSFLPQAEAILENTKCFYNFIDSIKEKYPDLIIENCGSGAMRSDNGTLKHFDLQSSSDQEDYLLYPSILVGSSALMAPEKLGIWAYPYPVSYEDRNKKNIFTQIKKTYKDGEQTIFNMVSGFMGSTMLSGRVDMCDEYNRSLIISAIATRREWDDFISEAFPVYPTKMKRISDKSFISYGLINADKSTMLLAVWNFDTTEFSIDLAKYQLNNIKPLYPENFGDYTFLFEEGVLKISSAEKNRARLFILSDK